MLRKGFGLSISIDQHTFATSGLGRQSVGQLREAGQGHIQQQLLRGYALKLQVRNRPGDLRTVLYAMFVWSWGLCAAVDICVVRVHTCACG